MIYKKHIFIFFLFILVDSVFGLPTITFSYTIPTDNSLWIPVNQFDVGYNTAQSWYYLFNYSNNPSVECKSEYFGLNGVKPCNDKVCLKRNFIYQWQKISGDLIRFPGGSVSQLYHSGLNAYDFNTLCPNLCSGNNHPNTNNSLFCGYGVKNQYKQGINCTDCEYIHSGYGDISNNLFGLTNFNDCDRDHSRNILYDCIELVKEREKLDAIPIQNYFPKIKVLYVINVFTHFYNPNGSIVEDPMSLVGSSSFNQKVNENLNAIRALLDNGINVVGIEFGNEQNLGQNHAMRYSVVDYVNLLKYYVDLIRSDSREALKNMKIGVNSEWDFDGSLNNYNCNFDLCLEDISSIPNAENYTANDLKIFKYCWNKYLRQCLDNSELWSQGKPLFDAFIFHGYPVVVNEDFKLATKNVFSQIDQFNNVFNSNYSISSPRNYWFTEWNQGNIEANKFINSAFILSFNTKLIEYNSNHPSNQRIEYSTFHNLLGGSYSIFNPYGNDFTEQNSYVSFNLMKKIKNMGELWNNTGLPTGYIPSPVSASFAYQVTNIDAKKIMLKLFKNDSRSDYVEPFFKPCLTTNDWDYFIFFVNNSAENININGSFVNNGQLYNSNVFLPKIYYYKYNVVSNTFDYSQMYESSTYQLPPNSIGIISCTQ